VLKNYRPVSNIPFISKVIERVVTKQLTNYICEYNLGDRSQSAYKCGHSTETALLKVKSDIDMALDNGDGVILVLLDLSAAFDTVDHLILYNRLENMFGIKGTALQFFISYLVDRYQQVQINEVISERIQLETGVPQGSVLGPLLFLCYMRPLALLIEKHGVMYHGYADDTQLYIRFTRNSEQSLKIAMTKMEACIENIKEWMLSNKLKLNEEKTEFLIISTNHFFKCSDQLPKLLIGQTYIPSALGARNLGVYFDREMNLHSHISTTIKSLYFHLRTIGKIRRYFNRETCRTVVAALVTSRLDYCNSLLSTVHKKEIHRLQMVQNNAARLVDRRRGREGIHLLLNELHWLPVYLRINYKLCLFAYKILNNNITSPDYLNESVQIYRPSRTLRSSNDSNMLTCPRSKSARGYNSFCVRTPNIWNSLPGVVRDSPNIMIFKKQLKTFLFKQCII